MTFEDVISQPHITTTLTNQLKNRQTAHAYLFTGSRGTGKTTCAKILAKALNCTDLKDGNPCLVCDSCRLIDEGTPDIIEIDAASNNGVDDVRALRDEIVYLPVSCKYRVYIIDEVHMLSISAFNALLKTIEEPPEHVVFILATTENHKVPATILSRCQRFEFHRINHKDSTARLLQIAEKENVSIDKEAAELISRLSDGGMRDALSLLDTCLSSSDNVTADIVRICSGVAGKSHLFSLSDAVNSNNSAAALRIINELHNQSKDMARLIDELIMHYRNLMLLKLVPSDDEILTCLPTEKLEYQSLAEKLNLEDIMRALEILTECFSKIGKNHERKIMAELCMIKLCTPRLDSNEKALLKRISSLEEKIASGNIQTVYKSQNITESATAISQKEPEVNISEPEPVMNNSYDEDFPPEPPEEKTTEPVLEASEPKPVAINAASKSDDEFREWSEALSELPAYISMMLSTCKTTTDGINIYITGNELAGSVVQNPDNYKLIISAIHTVTGKEYSIIFNEDAINNTPEENKLDKFLKLAASRGIEIKTKK